MVAFGWFHPYVCWVKTIVKYQVLPRSSSWWNPKLSSGTSYSTMVRVGPHVTTTHGYTEWKSPRSCTLDFSREPLSLQWVKDGFINGPYYITRGDQQKLSCKRRETDVASVRHLYFDVVGKSLGFPHLGIPLPVISVQKVWSMIMTSIGGLYFSNPTIVIIINHNSHHHSHNHQSQ